MLHRALITLKCEIRISADYYFIIFDALDNNFDATTYHGYGIILLINDNNFEATTYGYSIKLIDGTQF